MDKEFARLKISTKPLAKRCNISGDTLGTDSRKKVCHYEYHASDESEIVGSLESAGYSKISSYGSIGRDDYRGQFNGGNPLMEVSLTTNGNSGIAFMNMRPL